MSHLSNLTSTKYIGENQFILYSFFFRYCCLDYGYLLNNSITKHNNNNKKRHKLYIPRDVANFI